ncbi:MFS transporter [Aequorivita marina]|uniref:MFS transporter n=1 Tax=Aequorivita marina TaxID=3073654 RepID=UPI00287651B0|nr:MFS transporter [Aequorivita sp. S2608]MDS1299469.1 MFS transporter [Aequorivita sp. S2608]
MTQKLTNSTLYLMSISAGLIVANLYYNQPLLHQIAVNFGVSEAAVSNVALSTQLGYAFGLLFIIPLGDKVSNHKILQVDFLLMIFSLVAAALSNSLLLLIVSSFFIGFTSAVPQLFVPMAAQLSDNKGRGRAIGIVMSGLLIGILGSRVISGFVGEQFGWRVMYYSAAGLMVFLFLILRAKLPPLNPHFPGSYGSLLKSILHYFKTEPELRVASLRGALAFAGLSAFWTTLVFLMEDNFGYGSTITGLFGLLGIAGALGATVVGKLNDKINKNQLLLFSALLLIVSWIIFLVSSNSIFGLIVGVILVDLGLQALHITNQNIIFSKNPEGRNRINTVYMVSFFIGGALGTTLGALAWETYQWTGVSVLGLTLSACILFTHLFFRKA